VHALHACRIASIHWTCGRKEPYRDLPPIREPLTALGIRSYDFFAYPSMDYKLIYKYSLYWFFVNLPFYLNIFHIIIHVCMCMYWYMHVSKYYQLTTNVCIARPISSSMQCLCISLSIYRYLPISLSTCLPLYLPVYPPTYFALSYLRSIHPSTYVPTYLSIINTCKYIQSYSTFNRNVQKVFVPL